MWDQASDVDDPYYVSIAAITGLSGPELGNSQEGAFVRAMYNSRDRAEASQYGGVFYPTRSSRCPTAHGILSDMCPAEGGVTVISNATSVHSSATLFNIHAGAALNTK